MIATALVGSMGIMLFKQVSSATKTVVRNAAPLIRVDDNEINQEVAVGMFEDLGGLMRLAML